MMLFGRELTHEQVVGVVECNAKPDEDLVHRAALELIAALQEAERRVQAAVERDSAKPPKPLKHLPFIGRCQICKTELCIDDKSLFFCPTCGQRVKDGSWRGPQEADHAE